jgi:acyl-CoA synthetase (AMP-forming)/AMP-acid ligase II
MIVTGGFNVYPNAVENALAEFSGVGEVAVFGMPHPQWGEAVVAAVTVMSGADVTTAALDKHCREKVSKFEVPKHIAILPSLPRGNTDKVDKRAIQAMFAQPGKLPWEIEKESA